MPEPEVIETKRPVTDGELVRGLAELGVREGAIVMAHASLSRLGCVVGGSETVVRALLHAVGPAGRICAQASAHFEGRLAERIRTWPGASRSANPDASVAAVGARAAWLTAGHGPDDAFGAATPYAKLYASGGQIVLLGAPLAAISMLHHAEAIAQAALGTGLGRRAAIGTAACHLFESVDLTDFARAWIQERFG
jgi:aminoglycoside 3-N-acetyltransferase